MSDYKYPYIKGGKAMVAATLGACSMIRDTGYFNKAVKYYANKYGVDEDELEKNIRARQAAGQKGNHNQNAGKVYKWYLVCETAYCEADYEISVRNPQIVRGVSQKTVQNRFSDYDWKRTVKNDTGSSYSLIYGHKVIGEFETKAEAEQALPNWFEMAKRVRGGDRDA